MTILWKKTLNSCPSGKNVLYWPDVLPTALWKQFSSDCRKWLYKQHTTTTTHSLISTLVSEIDSGKNYEGETDATDRLWRDHCIFEFLLLEYVCLFTSSCLMEVRSRDKNICLFTFYKPSYDNRFFSYLIIKIILSYVHNINQYYTGQTFNTYWLESSIVIGRIT